MAEVTLKIYTELEEYEVEEIEPCCVCGEMIFLKVWRMTIRTSDGALLGILTSHPICDSCHSLFLHP